MVFVDSSFWIAATYRRDQRHQEAIRLFEQWSNQELITSNHVVGETWTFLRRRADHSTSLRFLDSIQRSPRVRTRRITEELEAEAWRWLRRHDERPYSFVDATSFALMRILGVRNALAFDGDFAAAGFRELRT